VRLGKRNRRIERILVVEDEPLVAFDTEHFLGDSGYRVVATVDRAQDAVAILQVERSVDLVLADVHLAEGDSGIDVARAASQRAVPVLFVTGHCPGEARALAAGCLAKPYQQRDLALAIDAIDRVLQGLAPRRLPSGFSLFADEVAGRVPAAGQRLEAPSAVSGT
jgi:CheY-like chemotaxis protein